MWKVTVTDNHYVQAVCATLGSTPLTGWIAPNETEAGAQSVVTFDLSDPAFSGLTQAKIGVIDYADNQTVSDFYSLTDGTTPDPDPDPEPEPTEEAVLASWTAPSSIQPGASLPVDFQLEKMKRVATVSFVFERDDAISGGTAVGKNGFTSLTSDIRWNGNKGVLMLSYLQDGVRGGSLTQEALSDVARVTFATTASDGANLGLTLTGVTVTGFDENGSAVTLKSTIQTPSLTVTARTTSYDVNRDGVIDQLDITTCQRWYQAASGDADWASAKVCDVNSDSKVDLQDMIAILLAIYS